MKRKELSTLPIEALKTHLEQAVTELDRLRRAHVISPLKNTDALGKCRRNIARIKTEQHSRITTVTVSEPS